LPQQRFGHIYLESTFKMEDTADLEELVQALWEYVVFIFA